MNAIAVSGAHYCVTLPLSKFNIPLTQPGTVVTFGIKNTTTDTKLIERIEAKFLYADLSGYVFEILNTVIPRVETAQQFQQGVVYLKLWITSFGKDYDFDLLQPSKEIVHTSGQDC